MSAESEERKPELKIVELKNVGDAWVYESRRGTVSIYSKEKELSVPEAYWLLNCALEALLHREVK